MTLALSVEQLEALDAARALAAAGVPVFVAPPDAASTTGFALPAAWQNTASDPAVVDRWQPGWALCAVMGHGLDLLDVDPRNGGDLSALDPVPTVYAAATTPSGGVHAFIASMGVGSRDGLAPGIDVKAGHLGDGHGFAFIAPTVRASKVTGEPGTYRWVTAPSAAAPWRSGLDVSGAALAARVRELRASGGVAKTGGPDWWREFMASKEPQSQAAADKAIAGKLAELAAQPAVGGAGFRNVLLRAAMTLGGYVGGGYLPETEAWAQLERAVSAVWGAADADDRLWIEQGLTDGAQQPFYVYTPEDEAVFGEAAQAVAAQRTAPSWSPYRALGTEAFDPAMCGLDQELAEAVAYRTLPVLRYAVDAGSWLVRGAELWNEREDLSGWAVAMVARLMPLGEVPVPKDVTQRTPGHWQAVRRQRLMSSGGAGGVEKKLRSIVRGGDHAASVELAELDGDPEVLWAGGVPWDLRRSLDEPVPAAIDPGTPHLHSAAVAPLAIDTPVWDAFVCAVWPDVELRRWALRVLSLSLAGYPDAALPVLYGPERTGKTALITLLVKVLGTYGHAADPRLLGSGESTHASVVYALKGRRLSFIDEGPRRGHLAAERLKQLTGGGQLTGNAMRSNPVTFSPTHTLVMTTNDEPPITDPALRARMRIIPCEADQAAVRAARQAITRGVWEVEAPGILAAMMRETAAWLAHPDSAVAAAAPADLRAVVDDMAAGQDPVREWVQDCTVPADPGTSGRDLYRSFVRWFTESPLYRRLSPPSETMFGRSLTVQGYPSVKSGGAWRRPLSVLGGPGSGMILPTPSVFMAGGPTGPRGESVAGSGGSQAGSGAEPAEPGNPSSSPVLGSAFGGLAGISRSISYANQKTQHTGENRDFVSDSPQTIFSTGPDQALSALAGPLAGSRQDPPSAPTGPEPDTSAHPDTNPANRTPAVTNTTVAARAYQGEPTKVITKAEARRQLTLERRAAERLAKIAEAGGELIELPAVADRAGNVLPVTLDQAAAVVRAALHRSGALTVDVEHSGYPVGHPDYVLRTVQLGDDVAAVVFHPVTHAEAIRGLIGEAPRLHAHSATADLVPLAHAGLIDAESGWDRMHDTVIPAKLADPQSTGSDPGLKALAGAVLGVASVAPAADAGRDALFSAGRWLKSPEVDTPAERSGWAQVDSRCSTMIRYAAADVLDTAALAKVLPALPPDLLERERTAQRMTARVAHRGVRIDGEHVRTLIDRHAPARAAAAERVRAYGIDKPGSSKQVAEALAALGAPLPRSEKTGAPSAAAGAIEPLRGAEGSVGDLADAVLDWRHHDTVLGLFLEPYRLICERGDGRARPTVYTLGTDTGRMSCVRPNLQQLSREGGVRACITADPGQVMIGADFSGVEIRVAAALSQDESLKRMLVEGRDLHAEIARLVWGPSAGKAERYKAKPMVFQRIYGGSVPGLARQAGVPQEVAQAVVDALDALSPQLSAWSAGISAAVRAGRTQFQSYSGRIIHLPKDRPHAAPNYCIQGSARELLIDSLMRWRQTPWGEATVLPVHDELDAFVPEQDGEAATAELVRCMETELFGVAITAEPSTPSAYWQDSV